MNRVATENIGNARSITLLGGRLMTEGGRLKMAEKDFFHPSTSYTYLSAPTSQADFLETVRKHYVKKGAVNVFNGSTIDYELKYVPVLKCGDKLLTLNNDDDDFITSSFFESPMLWDDKWNGLLNSVSDGCLSVNDGRLLPINLSHKEISYLILRLGLHSSEPLQVILLPFHVVRITNEKRAYNVAQLAIKRTEIVSDYPLFNDKTFSAIMHVLFFVVLYGACAVYIADHIHQARPFIEEYAKWWNKHLSIPDVREWLGGIVPILGWLVGMVIELILLLLLVILVVGIVPAIAIIVPAIVGIILAQLVVTLRSLWLKHMKNRMFNNALQRSKI